MPCFQEAASWRLAGCIFFGLVFWPLLPGCVCPEIANKVSLGSDPRATEFFSRRCSAAEGTKAQAICTSDRYKCRSKKHDFFVSEYITADRQVSFNSA